MMLSLSPSPLLVSTSIWTTPPPLADTFVWIVQKIINWMIHKMLKKSSRNYQVFAEILIGLARNGWQKGLIFVLYYRFLLFAYRIFLNIYLFIITIYTLKK